MKIFFIGFIRIYQLLLSPIFTSLGSGCRFYPTCSEYSKEAFRRHNWLKAMWLSAIRVLKCNPFNEGGLDPVEKEYE